MWLREYSSWPGRRSSTPIGQSMSCLGTTLKKEHPREGVLTLGRIKEIFLFSIPLMDTIIFLPRITTPITISTSHHEVAMMSVGYTQTQKVTTLSLIKI